MIIRVQSPVGCKRIECDGKDSVSQFLLNVQKVFEINSVDFHIYKDKRKAEKINSLEKNSLNDYDLKHGDLLYLDLINYQSNNDKVINNNTSNNKNNDADDYLRPSTSTSSLCSMSSTGKVSDIDESDLKSDKTRAKIAAPKEDDIDLILWKQTGRIDRPRDAKLCQHGSNSKCIHCSPIEPYNEGYLKEANIKHMSFHSYLRKMTSGIDRGKFAMLENISCKLKSGCKEHLPWPRGICTKCQPNAVTLNRQVYRHVDNVEFENASIVENFINYWRKTGHQRMGFLYGHYEIHNAVPLGIKAIVSAIYEPPQDSKRDMIKLHLPEPNLDAVEHIAKGLGLTRVGWIFTDLVPEDIKAGTVKYLRNAESYFLSAQECIMAGYFQTMHPNPCRLSPDGYFGSKFVTIIITGDKDKQIHMEGYQVSNQCMALVRDNCFLPTKDAPELGYVKETTKKQYVPDVFFKEKDNFNNEVTKLARLLPIEYLLIDVPVSSPAEPRFTFNPLIAKKHFPLENRMLEGHLQEFDVFCDYFRQFDEKQFLEAMSDFHLLLFLYNLDIVPLKDAIDPLLNAIKNRDSAKAIEWSKSEKWLTVNQLLLAHHSENQQTTSSGSGASGNLTNATVSEAKKWSCKYCTFENSENSVNCEMCGLPN